MRLEEGKNGVVKTCSFVYTQRHTHTHMHTPSYTQSPQKQLSFHSTFPLSSLVVFMFAKLPVFPNLTPLFLAFKFFIQLMRTGKEGGMFIAADSLEILSKEANQGKRIIIIKVKNLHI